MQVNVSQSQVSKKHINLPKFDQKSRINYIYLFSVADLRRISKCVYQNVVYEAGNFVKTGQPCLNCTCSNGAIVCHLRICSPIPDPPPQGCFVLHKKDLCCSELVCNEGKIECSSLNVLVINRYLMPSSSPFELK